MRLPNWLLAAVLIPLSGCVSLLPSAGDLAPRLALDPGEAADQNQQPRFGVSLAVADPEAASVFNTFDIAIATGPYEFEYLADAEWTDRVPVLLRRFLVRRFENERLFAAVGDRAALPIADYEVQSDIRSFNLRGTRQDRSAIMVVSMRLANARGETLGTRVFTRERPVAVLSRAGYADALNAVANGVADEAMAWIEANVAQDVLAEMSDR